MAEAASQATEYLTAHLQGDPRAAEKLLPLVYDQLRALAAHHMHKERMDHTLQATALVHEAYLRLVDGEEIDWQGRAHFFALAATTLRRVLVDHARGKGTRKRGGDAERIDLEKAETITLQEDPLDLLGLHDAIEKLAETHPRQAKVVDMRFFGGMGVAEVAHALGVGKDSVKADWKAARTWLKRELSRGEAGD